MWVDGLGGVGGVGGSVGWVCGCVGGLGLIIMSNLNRVRLSCCWVGLCNNPWVLEIRHKHIQKNIYRCDSSTILLLSYIIYLRNF